MQNHRSYRKALGIVLLSIAVTALGCSGSDEGVTSSNAKGSGNNADGTIGGVDGGIQGDAGGTSGGTSSGGASSGGSSSGADAGGTSDGTNPDSGTTAPKLCSVNGDCASAEHCALFYNQVKQLKGDDDGKGGKKLPGWANSCLQSDPKLAKLGAACDPYANDGDETLPRCHNSSACQQGSCTALCKSDSDCPKDHVCAASEVAVDVLDGAKPIKTNLVARVCTPMPGGGKTCTGPSDCGNGQLCRPYLVPGSNGALVTRGKCVSLHADKAKLGKACGAKSTFKGLGKVCDSALCQYTSGGQVPGICTWMCSNKSECPKTMTYGGIAYQTACSAILSATSGPGLEDDAFISQCILVHEKSDMADCTATRTCKGTHACVAFAIAQGGDKGASVEHFCVEQATKDQPSGPPKGVGEACTVGNSKPECKGAYCQPGADGKGYCSKTCLQDSDCGNGTSCKEHVLIKRTKTSAITKLCKK